VFFQSWLINYQETFNGGDYKNMGGHDYMHISK